MNDLVKIRAVLDTNVWINVFLHKFIRPPKQPYRDIGDALANGEFVAVYCEECFDELVYMLTESNLARAYGIDPIKGGEFVGIALTKSGEQVEITGDVAFSSDPDDDAFAEAALVGQVDFLVTDDTDLHEEAVIARLRNAGVRVVWSKQFRTALQQRRDELEKEELSES